MAGDLKELGEVFGLDPIDETGTEGEGEGEGTEPTEGTETGTETGENGDVTEDSDESEESDEPEEGDESQEGEPTPDPKTDKKKAQQNYKFAEMRQQVKKQTDLIKQLGKAIGLEDGTDVETISEKVKELLLERQSKESNIPVETLQRISELESLVEENQRIKLEKETTEAFTSLIEKYNLDSEAVNEFTQYLIDNDKNPLDGVQVDLESEYLKLHYDDLVQAAVKAALESDNSRREKAKNHAAGKASDKKGSISKEGDYKIDSVRELNQFLADKDL